MWDFRVQEYTEKPKHIKDCTTTSRVHREAETHQAETIEAEPRDAENHGPATPRHRSRLAETVRRIVGTARNSPLKTCAFLLFFFQIFHSSAVMTVACNFSDNRERKEEAQDRRNPGT
jgi:hypothetical protein